MEKTIIVNSNEANYEISFNEEYLKKVLQLLSLKNVRKRVVNSAHEVRTYSKEEALETILDLVKEGEALDSLVIEEPVDFCKDGTAYYPVEYSIYTKSTLYNILEKMLTEDTISIEDFLTLVYYDKLDEARSYTERLNEARVYHQECIERYQTGIEDIDTSIYEWSSEANDLLNNLAQIREEWRLNKDFDFDLLLTIWNSVLDNINVNELSLNNNDVNVLKK